MEATKEETKTNMKSKHIDTSIIMTEGEAPTLPLNLLSPSATRSVMMHEMSPSRLPYEVHHCVPQTPTYATNSADKVKCVDKLAGHFANSNFHSDLSYTIVDPLPAPFYLEPYSYFTSKTRPCALLSVLEEVFSSTHIDYEIYPVKYLVKCLTYQFGSTACYFRVRLYKKADSDDTLVEFQKRRGSIVYFNQMYRTVLTKLGSRVINNRPPREFCSFDDLPPLPASDEEDVYKGCKLLIDMVSAPQADIQREACQALVQMSQQETFSKMIQTNEIASDALVPILLSLLQSGEEDIVRNAAAFLYNLLALPKQDTLVHCALTHLVPSLFQSLQATLSYLNKDTKRQVSACLLVLAQCSSKHDSRLLTPYRDVLSMMRHCGDAQIRSNVACTLALMSAW